ncbi:uncharacterized protein DUF4126 [Stella humosa]|uniref:Uncharacterized protein DUF4126 n=1 Tax=Stella humosa TaxID=94 RepID=A0A3N1M2Q3_9PROT|nr:DUF4126 domain-containing protein [Stella humosa]ROQ01814.1 uncharacterized protein DUF4126 [Stella humosa]BBK32201.1 hypothetical protein STHU_28350 [Stella humosa]
MDPVSAIALTLGVGWASGINLYAAMLALGLMGATGAMALPPDLQLLASPIVILAAGLMYAVEFVADKVPGVDSGWDALHTFVRIPAGALLAAGSAWSIDPSIGLAAGLVGGTLATAAHATKASTRLVINTSPEPFSNWGASIGEDIAVFAGLWAAVQHPWVFIVLMVAFIALVIWLLPKLFRVMGRIFRRIGRWLNGGPEPAPAAPAGPQSVRDPPNRP